MQQTVAHMLTEADRFVAIARGGDYRRARHPREVDVINQEELETVMAPIPALADQMQSLAPEMDGYFDALTDRAGTFPLHHAMADAVTAQTIWLAELLFHGHDVAKAVKARWKLPERDMALVLRGALQIGDAWLRRDIGTATDMSVTFEIPGARPYLIRIHGGHADIRERRAEDRPDAVLKGPCVSLHAIALPAHRAVGRHPSGVTHRRRPPTLARASAPVLFRATMTKGVKQ